MLLLAFFVVKIASLLSLARARASHDCVLIIPSRITTAAKAARELVMAPLKA
jgi:hypothetical protein